MRKRQTPPPMTFRVSGQERMQIIQDAGRAGMKPSSYIRSRLLKEPKTAPVYQSSETRQLVKYLIGHIGRTGNNMNQIAAKLNSSAKQTTLDSLIHREGIKALQDMRSLLIAHLLQRS